MIIKIAMCVVGWMFAIAKLSLPEAHVTISGRSNSSILKQKEHTANFQPFYLAQYCSFESNKSSKKAFVLLFLATRLSKSQDAYHVVNAVLLLLTK